MKSNETKGCLFSVIVSFVMLSSIAVIIVNSFFSLKKDNKDFYIAKSKPIDPNDLMNPISEITPTKYQIESTQFKSIRPISSGGSNQEIRLEIRDSNDYCYFINEYNNYIYPLIVDHELNRFWFVNYLSDPAAPVIHYLRVAIKEPVFKITHPNSIEEQREWLRVRTKKNVFGNKTFKDPSMEGSCSNSPRVNIIAIEYSIDQKRYKYHVDSKYNLALNQHLEYVFK